MELVEKFHRFAVGKNGSEYHAAACGCRMPDVSVVVVPLKIKSFKVASLKYLINQRNTVERNRY